MNKEQLSFLDLEKEKMTIKEFKEYLNRFNDEDNFSIIVLNTDKRKVAKQRDIFLLEDTPAVIFDVQGFEKY